MKFTLSWLRDHLDTDAGVDEIARTLNAIGLEVEGIEDRGAALASFRIARVIEATQHPNADRLRHLRVDVGDGVERSVVCGAPNARTGMMGVAALPGAFIPGTGITLKVGEIRGVKSEAMMLSAREMGLGDDHYGIVDLPADAPLGAVLREVGRPRRPDHRDQRHAEPRRCAVGARHRAGPGGGGARHAEAVVGAAGARDIRSAAELDDRRPARLPLCARARRAWREERALAAMAAGPADGDRAAADQRAGRHHQPVHLRPRPPAACLRRGQGEGHAP